MDSDVLLELEVENSDNKLYEEKIGWAVYEPLIEGMKKTYEWINQQVNKN